MKPDDGSESTLGISFLSEHAEKLMTTMILLSIKRSDDLVVFISSSKRNSDYLAFLRAKIGIFFLTSKFSSSERREKLVFALLSRENRWSSKSHHACMFGRVVTEVNAVKIRPTGQMISDLFQKPDGKIDCVLLLVITDPDVMAGLGEGIPGDVEPAVAGEQLVGMFADLQVFHESRPKMEPASRNDCAT
jgi:hypothetical protein